MCMFVFHVRRIACQYVGYTQANLSTVYTSCDTYKWHMYINPPPSLKAWVRLEATENEREVALRKELMRQEKLEQLAEKFGRKSTLRESWLADMSQVLEELDKGQDVHAVDAALQRHEAISADVHAGVSGICFLCFSCSVGEGGKYMPVFMLGCVGWLGRHQLQLVV